MTRISTAGNYAISLNNLSLTQQRQVELGRQISSQKIAQDLKGYAGKSETLISMRSIQARVDGLIDQNRLLADRYATQDVALSQISDATSGVREAIANALASGRGDTLMEEISGHFTQVVQGLNTKSQGRYIFAGGQINTMPVTAGALSDLGAAPAASFFQNDRFIAKNQIDETSTIEGGMLADDIAGSLFSAFKTIQDDHAATPFTGALTDAQRAFLQTQLAVFDARHDETVQRVARNGTIANRIDSASKDLQSRANAMETMIGDVADVDMAEAISNLQMAQFAVQAAAEVFVTLRDSSLLNYLR